MLVFFLKQKKYLFSLNDSKVKKMATVLPLTFIHMEKMKRKYFIYYKGKLYEITKHKNHLFNEVNINKITEFMKNNKNYSKRIPTQ